MPQPAITAISPFFIVSNVTRTIAFYREKLGFECTYRQPKADAFFAMLRRGGAQLFVKSEQGITPLPNSSRHPHMRWDACLFAHAPDHLAAEFQAQGVPFSAPLADTDDGLRGFEVTDPDGYVLFFGCPRADAAI
jgi:catechol 2,3-dioxygenase-like lactoylglutathione lyase family enzyme